jgi:hypothetical protein
MPAVTLLSKPNGEPIATTHSPTLRTPGSPKRNRWQAGGLDLDQRDIGSLVSTNDPGLELTLVGQTNQDLVSPIDHVRIGQYIAVGTYNEARTKRPALEFTRCSGQTRHSRLAGDKAAEELVHRIVLIEREGLCTPTVAADRLGRADIDHCWPLLFNQFGEIGETPVLRLRRQREQHEKASDEQLFHGSKYLLRVIEWRTSTNRSDSGDLPAEYQGRIQGWIRRSRRPRRCARRNPSQPTNRPAIEPPIAPASSPRADPDKAPAKSASKGKP